MFPIPPNPPSRGRGVTLVRGLCPLRLAELLPPWGGLAEATK